MAYKHPHTRMKRMWFFALMGALISITSYAQSFELTSNGFVDAENHEKTYIIKEFCGMKQQEIFTQASKSIGKVFRTSNNAINVVDGEQISIQMNLENVTSRSPLGMNLPFDMEVSLILEFKDGKMRINAPKIHEIKQRSADVYIYLTTAERGSTFPIHNYALFKSNGKVNEKKHKDNIQSAVNQLVDNIIANMGGNDDW